MSRAPYKSIPTEKGCNIFSISPSVLGATSVESLVAFNEAHWAVVCVSATAAALLDLSSPL